VYVEYNNNYYHYLTQLLYTTVAWFVFNPVQLQFIVTHLDKLFIFMFYLYSSTNTYVYIWVFSHYYCICFLFLFVFSILFTFNIYCRRKYCAYSRAYIVTFYTFLFAIIPLGVLTHQNIISILLQYFCHFYFHLRYPNVNSSFGHCRLRICV